MSKIMNIVRENDIYGLGLELNRKYQQKIAYQKQFLKGRVTEEELHLQRQMQFHYMPKISIVVPTYETPEGLLREMIESVMGQSYQNWELCLADGSKTENVCKVVAEIQEERVKYKHLNENKGIAENTNEAIALASGEYIAFLDHDDLLEKDALYCVVKAIQRNHADCIYSDEDKCNYEGTRFFDPHQKPEYNLELLHSMNYISHFFVVRRELLLQCGGLSNKYEGAQDYDVILKTTEKANEVVHISRVLYHWRMSAQSTASNPESKSYCNESGRLAVEDHLKRTKRNASVGLTNYFCRYHVVYEESDSSTATVIKYGTRNQKSNSSMEKIEVDNKKQNALQNKSQNEIQEIFWNIEENFPFDKVLGDYVIFQRRDVSLVNRNDVKELLGLIQQEEIALVCPKLLDSKNRILYAAGPYQRMSRNASGYMDYARVNRYADSIEKEYFLIKRENLELVVKNWGKENMFEFVSQKQKRICYAAFVEAKIDAK